MSTIRVAGGMSHASAGTQADGAAPMPDATRPASRTLARIVGWGSAAAVLAFVFAWYRDPDFIVELSQRAWACF